MLKRALGTALAMAAMGVLTDWLTRTRRRSR